MENSESILDDIDSGAKEAGTLQRVVANFIDWIISMAFIVAWYFYLSGAPTAAIVQDTAFGRYIIVAAIMIGYRLLSILLFSKTIGMMICRTRYGNASGQPLSNQQKLVAALAGRTASIKYYRA